MASTVFAVVLGVVLGVNVALGLKSRPLMPLYERFPMIDDLRLLLVALLVFDGLCVGLLARFGAQFP